MARPRINKYIIVSCKYCHKKFEESMLQIDRKRSIYCSRECYSKDHRIIRNCDRCGKKFTIRKSRYKQSEYKFCQECYGKKIDIKCNYCGKLFEDYESNNKKYCNKECHNKAMQRKKQIKCRTCGKIFQMQLSKTKDGRGKYCSNKCSSIAHIGEGNPSWRGGISKLPYPFEWKETLKTAIRERDNYTCQLCNKKQNNEYRAFSVHHKDYDKKNINPDNLTTLCDSCHMATNFNRSYWIQYFMEDKNEHYLRN